MKIFINHLAENISFARVLQNWLPELHPDIDVVVCGDVLNTQSEADSFLKIRKEISDAKLIIVLRSSSSEVDPWINFVIGCGWAFRVRGLALDLPDSANEKMKTPVSVFDGHFVREGFVVPFFQDVAKKLELKRINKNIRYSCFWKETEASMFCALSGANRTPKHNLGEPENSIMTALSNGVPYTQSEISRKIGERTRKVQASLLTLMNHGYVMIIRANSNDDAIKYRINPSYAFCKFGRD